MTRVNEFGFSGEQADKKAAEGSAAVEGNGQQAIAATEVGTELLYMGHNLVLKFQHV